MCPDGYNQTTPACQAFLMPPVISPDSGTLNTSWGDSAISSFGLSTRQSLFSLSRPPLFSSLLASSVSSHIYWRDSLCTALQTGKLWIWSTGLSAQLIPSLKEKSGFWGTPFVPTGRSRPDIRGMRGRGGKSYVWRLFPWRISTFSAPW